MLNQKEIVLSGVAPLLMHNGQLANPLNEYSKAIAEVTSKRKKTETDFQRIAELEFRGSLYPQNVSNGQGPVIPAMAMTATLKNGARKDKNGKLFEAGVFVTSDTKIDYDGPRTADELWSGGFWFTVPVKVGQSKVMRTRPKFDKWTATVEITYDDEVVNWSAVELALSKAGQLVGVLEGRPFFGRFSWSS